ncbi:MAG: acylphosphatase [Candidatus Omnitrophica bacterium]|nr:acylphosphatase [Candidatus Omnitrophota bacterium]
MQEDISQVEVIYRGRVQGVGFRYTVRSIARSLKVAGWVKNLADGSVQLMAQADKQTLENFLNQIKEEFSGYIRDVDLTWNKPTQKWDSFEITF